METNTLMAELFGIQKSLTGIHEELVDLFGLAPDLIPPDVKSDEVVIIATPLKSKSRVHKQAKSVVVPRSSMFESFSGRPIAILYPKGVRKSLACKSRFVGQQNLLNQGCDAAAVLTALAMADPDESLLTALERLMTNFRLRGQISKRIIKPLLVGLNEWQLVTESGRLDVGRVSQLPEEMALDALVWKVDNVGLVRTFVQNGPVLIDQNGPAAFLNELEQRLVSAGLNQPPQDIVRNGGANKLTAEEAAEIRAVASKMEAADREQLRPLVGALYQLTKAQVAGVFAHMSGKHAKKHFAKLDMNGTK